MYFHENRIYSYLGSRHYCNMPNLGHSTLRISLLYYSDFETTVANGSISLQQ